MGGQHQLYSHRRKSAPVDKSIHIVPQLKTDITCYLLFDVIFRNFKIPVQQSSELAKIRCSQEGPVIQYSGRQTHCLV